MANNFVSSKDSDETPNIHTKSDNIEMMMGSEINEITPWISLQRYKQGLEESMKGSEFISYSVDVLYHNLNKISLNRGESYIDSPE